MLDLAKSKSILLFCFWMESFQILFSLFIFLVTWLFFLQFDPFILGWYKVGLNDLFQLVWYGVFAVYQETNMISIDARFGKIKFNFIDFFLLNPSMLFFFIWFLWPIEFYFSIWSFYINWYRVGHGDLFWLALYTIIAMSGNKFDAWLMLDLEKSNSFYLIFSDWILLLLI